MRLTTKGRYAVTAMLDLAINAEKNPISLCDISDRQKISLSYLEQLFAKLRRRDLIVSARGPGGGYQLAHTPSDVSIASIIDAVDECVDARRCQGVNSCDDGNTCLTHSLWDALSEQIHDFLTNITLQNLLDNQDILAVAKRQTLKQQANYPINEKIDTHIID